MGEMILIFGVDGIRVMRPGEAAWGKPVDHDRLRADPTYRAQHFAALKERIRWRLTSADRRKT